MQAHMFRRDKQLSAFLDARQPKPVPYWPLRFVAPSAFCVISLGFLAGYIGFGLSLGIVLYLNFTRVRSMKDDSEAAAIKCQLEALQGWLDERYPKGAPYTSKDLYEALRVQLGQIEPYYLRIKSEAPILAPKAMASIK